MSWPIPGFMGSWQALNDAPRVVADVAHNIGGVTIHPSPDRIACLWSTSFGVGFCKGQGRW